MPRSDLAERVAARRGGPARLRAVAGELHRDGPVRRRRDQRQILEASAAIGVPILVGAIVDGGPNEVLNQGIVWDPETGAGDRYTKRHPVPFGEYVPLRSVFLRYNFFDRLRDVGRDMLTGTRDEPLDIGGVPVADAICFDVAYDDGITAQVSRGAELLVVQTSNATFIRTDQIDQQFAITRLRAIETGRWTAVASTNGVTGVIAPDGEVVDVSEPRTQDVLVERVALIDTLTPATRIGARSGLFLGLLTLVGLALALVRRRPETEHEEPPDRARGRAGGRAMTAGERTDLGRVLMVVPTYNEADNLEWIVGRLREAQPDRRRARRRRRLTRRHRGPGRRAGVGGPGRPRAAPEGEGRSGRGVPRRVRLGTRGRLRRRRRDGRGRLAPARAAGPAADGAGGRRPGHRVPVGPGRVRRQLAPAARAAVPGRQPLRPAAARHRGPRRHRGLPAVPPLRAGEDRPRRPCAPPATSSRPTWSPGASVPGWSCARCPSSSSSGCAATPR